MRNLIALLAGALAAACPALAGVAITSETPGPFDLYKGTKKIATFATLAACRDGAMQQAATSTFTCRTSVTLKTKTFVDPPAPPVTMHGGLPVNASTFMVPYAGRNEDLLIPTAELPVDTGVDASGDFRTLCLSSHMSFDDPIVYPGQPGKAHGHVFGGNALTDAFTTSASLVNTGGSTCRGGTINRTAYWAPIAMDENGNAKTPQAFISYYKTGYVLTPDYHARIVPPPVGLKMIAGNPNATARPDIGGPVVFSCDNDTSRALSISEVVCPVGHALWMSVGFPQCWDGVNLDSADHKSHMHYPVWTAQGGQCPATHPVAIPEITVHVLYAVPPEGTQKWRLTSDGYLASNLAQPTGWSLHADYMFGWKPEIAKAWTESCINKNLDCHAHLIGDGRQMVEFDGN